MTTYAMPEVREHDTTPPATAFLIASGDLRPSANVAGWPIQAGVEESLTRAFTDLGWTLHRAYPVDREKGHGFIDSQRMGLAVFASIPPDAPLVVAEAVWQYSHHVLAGLRTHRGPILTVANFAGDWPGPGRAARTERGADEDGHAVLHALERRLHRLVVPRRPAELGRDGPDRARHEPRPPAARTARHPREGTGRGAGRPAADREGDHRRLRRGLHGDVQRDHRRRAAQPARHLQGAALAERPVRRDAPGARRGGGRGGELAGGAGHALRDRHRRGHRAHRDPARLAVQDVHRRAADQRRLRAGRRRDPVPAGAEGPGSGIGPGRGPAQQRRAASGHQPRREPRAVGGPGTPPLQRGRRGRGRRRAGDQPRVVGHGAGPGHDAARRPLGRAVRRRVRVGVRDLRVGAAFTPSERLRRCRRLAPEPGVLPRRRQHHQGRVQAGRDRLVARVHRRGRTAPGHRPGNGCRAAGGGDGAPLGGDQPGVADHARRCCTASRATSSWPGTRPTMPRSPTRPTPRPPTGPCWPRRRCSPASA